MTSSQGPKIPSSAPESPQARLTRAVHFSAAYAYAQAKLGESDHRALYGRWHAPDGMGCNFRAECSFEGPIDQLTGMVANLADVDAWLKSALAEFDHLDLRGHARLGGSPATADAIARAFHEAVAERIPLEASCRLVRTRLYEGSLAWSDVVSGELAAISGDRAGTK